MAHLRSPAETWERITAAARELGYAPNRFAQALKTNRTMTIACIVPDITNPFYPALMRGIQSITDGLGYDVIAVNTDGTPERERHLLEWSAARPGRRRDRRFLHAQGHRFQAADRGRRAGRAHRVRRRSAAAICRSTTSSSTATPPPTRRRDYLIGRGHKRIAMIAGRGGPQAVRVEGYRAALAGGRRSRRRRARRRCSTKRAAFGPPQRFSPAPTSRPRSLPPTT